MFEITDELVALGMKRIEGCPVEGFVKGKRTEKSSNSFNRGSSRRKRSDTRFTIYR